MDAFGGTTYTVAWLAVAGIALALAILAIMAPWYIYRTAENTRAMAENTRAILQLLQRQARP